MPQKQLILNNSPEEIASKNLFASDFYHLKHWSYDLLTEKQTIGGYNDCLCMMYVKKGNFISDLSVKIHDMYSGYILVEKADCEYKMKPSAGECTIVNFTDEFWNQSLAELKVSPAFFFANKNLLSVILKSTPETDYLHHQMIHKLSDAGKLEMDNLVMEFFTFIMGMIANSTLEAEVTALLKVNRLPAVEMAKEYMNKNFMNDISLQEVSANSYVSPFHFSRIFKRITSFSPHQYLQNIRLKHSEMLLKNSSMPVSEIAYASGFASTAYFATAFKQKYKMNPLQYRKLN